MRNSAQNEEEGEHNHTEHWGKIGTLWREDWIYSKAFNCLKLFENSLYFCILMSLKICKLVIIKQPFSLAQPPRRPWGNLLKTSSFWCENQTVMTPLREKNALHYWWYVLQDYPVKIKRKNILWHGLCFISFPVTASLIETVYACKISRLRHCLFWVYGNTLPQHLLWAPLCKQVRKYSRLEDVEDWKCRHDDRHECTDNDNDNAKDIADMIDSTS